MMLSHYVRTLVRLLILAIFVAMLTSCENGENATNQTALEDEALDDETARAIYEELARAAGDLPAFEIVGNTVSDQTDRTAVSRQVVLHDEPTEENVRALLEHHHTRLSVQGPFENRPTPSDIIVLVFASLEQAQQDADSWIGRSVKTTNEKEPQIEIRLP